MTVDELAVEVRRLSDREAIREALARYFRGVDRKSKSLILSVFHDDATVDYGGLFKGSARDLAEVMLSTLQDAKVVAHYGAQVSIDLEADQARTEAYAIAFHRYQVEGREWNMVMGARILDRFERRARHWRIAHRQVIYDWNEDAPSNETWGSGIFPGAAIPSRSLAADPSLEFLARLDGRCDALPSK